MIYKYMKRCLSFAVLSGATAAMISCSGSPEGVSLPRAETPASVQEAVDSIIAADERMDAVRFESIMVLKHGKVIFEQWYNGASADKPHVMHSVSKTFTSTAIGMAIDEGLLSLDDRVVDFFPDKLPQDVSDNLNAMTVRDLLTMNCGHESSAGQKGDWVENFLAVPVVHQPGTWYYYNSMGTYMLSAILQKLTGEKLVDYLDSRLFRPLGIEKPKWEESPQGINAGGWGLHIKTEDMAKFGQLLLQRGEWNGRQLVSASWVDEASAYQVPSVPAGTRPDEVQQKGLTPENCSFLLGYGYQMWRCPMNAYRADGARGQYIMVLPDADAVIAVTADTEWLQGDQYLIYRFLFPALIALP